MSIDRFNSVVHYLVCAGALAATLTGGNRCCAQSVSDQPQSQPQVTVQLQVEALPQTVDFSRDVIPLLTQAGCNSGACHGAAAGRGYLALSLFGSRPEADYEALLFAIPGRFVDVQQPATSLILQKPGGYLEHGGGERLDSDGPNFALLKKWIAQRAPRGKITELVSLTISPGSLLVGKVAQPIHLSVDSIWSDGSSRDMTRWVTVTDAQPSGTEHATVEYRVLDNILELTPRAVGYWPITVRVGKQVATVQLFIKQGNAAESGTSALKTDALASVTLLPSGNSIDTIVQANNNRLELSVAGRCSPTLLARRLWLDLVGRHPSPDEWNSAIEEIDRGQVAGLVDRLLDSNDFTQHAGHVLANWVGAQSQAKRNTDLLAAAITDELRVSDDLQSLVRHMLLVPSEGQGEQPLKATAMAVSPLPVNSPISTTSAPHPLTVFHHFASDPRLRAELIAATFLGVRVGCAQCHDHPLDHWTQDDYFAMAACWAEIDIGNDSTVRRIAGRTSTDLRTGRNAVARLPFATVPFQAPGGNLLGTTPTSTADEAFVDWLCNSDNSQFSRNLANRVWAWLLGTGLVEELDDHRITNPAIHEELLKHLAEQLRATDFSLRELVRTIVLSETYARVADSNAPQLYRKMLAVRNVKPISRDVQQIASDALGVVNKPSANRTSQSMDMMMESATEGCSRQSSCVDPISEGLELVAGERLNPIIEEAVARESQNSPTSLDLLHRLHSHLFGRLLTAEEVAQLLQRLEMSSASVDMKELEIVEDIVWSWIVSPQFRQQH